MNQTIKQKRALKTRTHAALEWLCWAAASGVALSLIVVAFLIALTEGKL